MASSFSNHKGTGYFSFKVEMIRHLLPRKILATDPSYHRLVIADNQKSSLASEIRFDRTSCNRVLFTAKRWIFIRRGFGAIENTGAIYRRISEMETHEQVRDNGAVGHA
jgi:hypothetical protein